MKWTGGVHPVADLFPMLADDELKELAEDIKQRGLLQPIVLDEEGRVLDGRNRLAACEMAGVEPRFETFAGDDPDGFAWSVNVKRRNLTKAQIAVMAADRFADKNLSTRDQAAEAGVSQPMMVWAQAVRRYPDLHDDVLRRAKPLTDAYALAQERDAAEARRQAEIDRLRASASDLLSLVDDERMSLDDATAALDAREEKARQEEADRQERERQEQATAERLAALPNDLASRVANGDIDFVEAEKILKERRERIEVWAEKLRTGLRTFGRMAGSPIPDELKAALSVQEVAAVAAILGAMEGEDYGFLD